MPKLSPTREAWPSLPWINLSSRGKVRDSYELPGKKRVVVVTDGISARDYVLNAMIPSKGIILNAMTVFWLKMMQEHGIKHHMLAYGAAIDEYLPEALWGNIDRQSRTMIVQDLEMDDAEFVVRGHLTGSAVTPYNETGEVCGHKIPSGLQDGDELPCFLLTPTTKAKEGHDLNVPAEEIIRRYPMASNLSLMVYQIGYNYARSRGIIIPDTKFELAGDVLADEVLTSDSSRFWGEDDWLISRKPETGRKAPGSYDKDPVRTWLDGEISKWQKEHGNVKMDPENPEHVDAVHKFIMPQLLIDQSVQRYRYIFWRLTGATIEKYLHDVMKVNVPERPAKKVAIICGSETDKPTVMPLISKIGREYAEVTLHIMSCHRNPQETADFVIHGAEAFDVIVAVGSKALALPGILDAWAHCFDKNVRFVGVALGDPHSQALEAAKLSIEEIPGAPVIMNEITGKVYAGPEGFCDAMTRIIHGELPPEKPRKEQDVQMNVWSNLN